MYEILKSINDLNNIIKDLNLESKVTNGTITALKSNMGMINDQIY
jgi:hypothetical protein